MDTLKALLDTPLPKEYSKSVKRTLGVIDCETDPFKQGRLPSPFIWGFYDGEIYEEFETVDEMLTFFDYRYENDGVKYRIYAHNGGKFDYHFMLEHLEADSQIMIINGRLSKFVIGPTEFRDSYNLFNFPLAAYKKDDMDYSLMEKEEREKPHIKKKISDYLQKDCIYLYELVEGFIDRYGLHLTQASASIKIWQELADIKAPETGENYYDSLKPYYYGGRVECFKKGIIDQGFSVIDITSAYPFAMKFKHPFSTEYKTLHNRKANEYIKEKGGIESDSLNQCFFKVLAKSRGALPFRNDEGSLIFPNDNLIRKYTVTGWEIQAGLRTGTLDIFQILEVSYWKECTDFSIYVDYFFKLKNEAQLSGDKLGRLFAKLFLNSLYGKFAADPRKYKTHVVTDPREIEFTLESGFEPGGFLGKWFLAKKDLMQDRKRFYNIATAASITGFVRAYLWETACKCEGLLYSDTDSIAAINIDNVSMGSNLGDWESEGDFSYGAIGGKKMYAFKYSGKQEWKIASKGARLSADQVIEVAKGKEVIFDPIAPTYSVRHEPRFTQRRIVRT